MITGFFGDLGSGKTLSMTKYGYAHYLMGYNVYANYGLSFPHMKVDAEFLQDCVKDNLVFDGKNVFLLDELDMYLDSRSAVSKKNKVIGYFVKQIRKKDIRLFYATQMEHSVDKRLRNLTRTHVLCSKDEVLIYPYKESRNPYIINILTNHIFINRRTITTKRYLGNTYYSLYDTKELIVYEDDDTKGKEIKNLKE